MGNAHFQHAPCVCVWVCLRGRDSAARHCHALEDKKAIEKPINHECWLTFPIGGKKSVCVAEAFFGNMFWLNYINYGGFIQWDFG